MISKVEDPFLELRGIIQKQKSLVEEIDNFQIRFENARTMGERNRAESQIISVKRELMAQAENASSTIKKVNLVSKLTSLGYRADSTKEESERDEQEIQNYYSKDLPLRSEGGKTYGKRDLYLHGLEKETIRRLKVKEKERIKPKKSNQKSGYTKVSNLLFSNLAKSLLEKESFKSMKQDLIKANLDHAPSGYISVILFTTLLSFFVGGFLFLFFLFFNLGSTIPMITRVTETLNVRLLKVFWILFAVPIATFLAMYYYPHLEKRATEVRIEEELPFATIHMAAISGSMIDPIKIFEIIVDTGEYPALRKEFTKLLNEINLYGSDFVNALQNCSRNTSSKKLGELYNGLATNINSGGDLPSFFDKRSETLLFEHQIVIQKAGKAAETFMDVYISVVIAAPMILMILLMMMKLSGIGLSMSVGMITLIMISIVAGVNVVFLMFLHMKKR